MNLTSEILELKNVAQHIADKLEDFIVKGTLAPGSRLIQTKVAEQFGVSRLPVRDAFAILVKKELAIPLPRKGIVVRPILVREIHDLFELRQLIECYAFSRSAPQLTNDDLAQASALIRQQATIDAKAQFLQLLEVDETFHQLLWSRFDNQEMLQVLNKVWKRIKLIRAHARDLRDWKQASVTHHEQIISALAAKNFTLATQLVAEGIQRSEKELTEVIGKIPSPESHFSD